MRKTIWLLAVAMSATVCAGHAQKLNGAGATFPYPIYSKWFSEYSASHPGVQINYQSIGSGGGIRQVTAGTVDFGASDVPMTDEQLAASKVKIQAIPTVLGAVVPIFNVQGVSDLRIGPDVLADIYLGKITKWDDARIAKDNPGVKLPSADIFVVHRSDGSGTTFIFTDYLSKVSKDWAGGPGKGAAPSLAQRHWRQRQRRRRRLRSPIARLDRIRRADLRPAEQDPLRLCQNRRRNLGQGIHRRSVGSGGEREEHARRLPCLHHQCARERLSHLQLHLAADSQPSQGSHQRESPDRFSQVDAGAPERGQLALLRAAACFGGPEGQRYHQHSEVGIRCYQAHTAAVCA